MKSRIRRKNGKKRPLITDRRAAAGKGSREVFDEKDFRKAFHYSGRSFFAPLAVLMLLMGLILLPACSRREDPSGTRERQSETVSEEAAGSKNSTDGSETQISEGTDKTSSDETDKPSSEETEKASSEETDETSSLTEPDETSSESSDTKTSSEKSGESSSSPQAASDTDPDASGSESEEKTEEKSETGIEETSGTGSEKDTDPEPGKETKTDPESKGTADPESKGTSAPEPEGKTDPETETSAEEKETGSESASDKTPEVHLERFMGHLMDPEIKAVNDRTLQDPRSHLFNVADPDVSFTREQVLQMILSYSLPETRYYGEQVPDDVIKNALERARNLGVLSDDPASPVSVGYAIASENCHVAGFPTDMRAWNPDDPGKFNYFLESLFAAGSGMFVLHYSEDGAYAFVQGENYAGWVRTSAIALTDRDTYYRYMNPDRFVVCTRIFEEDHYRRLGQILPCTGETESGYRVLMPKRNAEGRFFTEEETLSDKDNWSDGFLPWSREALLQMIWEGRANSGYGYSDEYYRYDCSSTTGYLYRCFGLYLPRNTVWMDGYGGGFEALAPESDKAALLEAHPGAVIVMPRHAMLYLGVENGKHMVFHNTTWNGVHHTIINALEDMYRSSGDNYLEALTMILYY
ncbi:MAG: SH3 domain-containing protein [Lachnospiraceae bacterium]|nr:SH3 domain-containing protein [Lachnospiraceae bacterium]